MGLRRFFPYRSVASSSGRRPLRLMLLTAGLALACTGCFNAQNTRFPSLYTWMPSAENEAYEKARMAMLDDQDAIESAAIVN